MKYDYITECFSRHRRAGIKNSSAKRAAESIAQEKGMLPRHAQITYREQNHPLFVHLLKAQAPVYRHIYNVDDVGFDFKLLLLLSRQVLPFRQSSLTYSASSSEYHHLSLSYLKLTFGPTSLHR
ncbi:hypothetical protein L249_8864 [Ophiocordyceps polyrhachis-furcata BCC 54312]|uniref:Uncharacterized protein n=1 Tax=Ophiocordyceps polyrhachis-furcata BCC 54312 TaxID=1330021 RepID=A0A367L1U3_9HYPO|nr:hypothetical protein L249_8864 [Ophiocordyceps polyrhachis-furcata BCC 54312]